MDGQMVKYGEGERHEGYLTMPESGVGPGVLVLHAWWGLNEFFKSLCDRLAAEGYVAFAPDLYRGKIASTIDEASHLVETSDQTEMATAALEAVRFIVQQPGVRPIGIGVIGFSLGAAFGAQLATLRPKLVRAVVMFYGTQMPDFGKAEAAFLGHFCEEDEWEPREGVDGMLAGLRDANLSATFHFYTGVGHWFFEADRPDAYRQEPAQLAWERTLAFLAERLADKDEPFPGSTDELVFRIHQGWAEIHRAIKDRAPKQLTRPGPDGWSVREHLAHVTFWERLMLLSQIGDRPATEVAEMDEATLADFNAVNAIVAQRSQGRSVDEVWAEAIQVHSAMIAELRAHPFETWMRPRFPDEPDERPLLLWIAGNTYTHYGEHAEYIRRLLASHR